MPEQYSLKIDGVLTDAADIVGIKLVQTANSHHIARIKIVGVGVDPLTGDFSDPDTYKDYLGKSMSLIFETDEVPNEPQNITKEFNGIINNVSFENKDDEINVIVITAKSPTILMDGIVRNKLYSDMSASDVINSVLSKYSMTLGTVTSTSSIMPYCVQYRETDYNFVKRLAAANGLFAYYNGTKFIVSKAEGDNVALMYGQGLKEFKLGLGTTVEKFQAQSYDRTKKETLTGESASSLRTALSGLPRASHDASKSLYPEASFIDGLNPDSQSALDKSIETSRESSIGKMIPCTGKARFYPLQVGEVVEINGLGQQVFGRYWVTRSTHTWTRGSYECSFGCTPIEAAYPRKISRPLFMGLQPAIVTSTNDPDNMGRVQVAFSWNDGSSQANPTIWLQVITPHAGPERGFFCLPEIDDEVMVMFEHGNPDRPVIVGSVYNGMNKPPTNHPAGFDPPQNDLKVWRTKGNNEIIFHDASGAETLTLSQKDGSNFVKLTMDGPKIIIESEGDVEIKGATITIESTSGDVTIKSAGALKAESTADMELKGGGNLKAEGTMNFEAKGGIEAKISAVTTKVEGSAMTEVKGGIVKIN